MTLNAWLRLVRAGYQGIVLAVVVLAAIGTSTFVIDRVTARIESKVNDVAVETHANQQSILELQRTTDARVRQALDGERQALVLLRAILTDQQQAPATRAEVSRLLSQSHTPGPPGPRGPSGSSGHDGHDGADVLTGACSPAIVAILTAC